jgi:hypothetical protein
MKLTVKVLDENGKEVKAADIRKAWSVGIKTYQEAKKVRDELNKKLETQREVVSEAFSQLVMLKSIGEQMSLNFVMPKQRAKRTK